MPHFQWQTKQKALRSRERLHNSVKDRNAIAEETKGQHETRAWFDVRKPRITASKCKRCLENGSHREIVPFDSVFWENIFPELVYLRILHGE